MDYISFNPLLFMVTRKLVQISDFLVLRPVSREPRRSRDVAPGAAGRAPSEGDQPHGGRPSHPQEKGLHKLDRIRQLLLKGALARRRFH